jgi:hypothetical protein
MPATCCEHGCRDVTLHYVVGASLVALCQIPELPQHARMGLHQTDQDDGLIVRGVLALLPALQCAWMHPQQAGEHRLRHAQALTQGEDLPPAAEVSDAPGWWWNAA